MNKNILLFYTAQQQFIPTNLAIQPNKFSLRYSCLNYGVDKVCTHIPFVLRIS